MIEIIKLTQGDLSPSLLYYLEPTTIVLTDASAFFSMSDKDGSLIIDHRPAVIVTETETPTLRYDWQAADVAQAGEFRAQFKVIYPASIPESFPNNDYLYVNIIPSLKWPLP